MATGTYKITNNPIATYGENSASTGALQRAINASGGISTPIAVDNRYGDQTKAAYDSLIKSGYTYSNGSFIKPVPTNVTTDPIISGTQTENENNAITLDVTNLKKTYDDNSKFLQDRIDALEEQRKQDIAQIRADFEAASIAQGERQKKDYAGRATSLVTSGGGFLGATQSQSGVLQNLQATFEQENAALMAKRDAAIREAENAINEKQFALAKEKASEARSYEQEVYNRQKDFADQKLALAREARAQQEFDMGVADKKIAAYATMDDATFAKITPAQLAETDKNYFPGYTVQSRIIAQKAAKIKTQQDAIAIDSDILNMRLKITYGQKFTLAGQTYTGLNKTSTSLTATEREIQLQQGLSTLLSPGRVIPGTTTPIIDTNGYVTPEGWKDVIKLAVANGMTRENFIKQYGNLIPYNIQDVNGDPITLDQYGLTAPEKVLITNVNI